MTLRIVERIENGVVRGVHRVCDTLAVRTWPPVELPKSKVRPINEKRLDEASARLIRAQELANEWKKKRGPNGTPKSSFV